MRHRKFIIAASALIAGVALCAFGRLTGADFVALSAWVVGAFCSGNALEHVASAARKRGGE